MIAFESLDIGVDGRGFCRLCDGQYELDPHPASLDDLKARITSIAPRAMMLVGFEPFSHPDLVAIIEACTEAGIDRIGMRTHAGALGNPNNALGCISAGVRAFEVPIATGSTHTADRVTGVAGQLEATWKGIAQIKAASRELCIDTFIGVLIPLCPHTAPHLIEATGAAIRAGADAIRLASVHDYTIERQTVATAHTMATRAGVALFGDGCEDCIEGAVLYRVNGVPSR